MRINWFKDENNLVYINGATQLAELERTLRFPGLEEAANELRKHPTPEGLHHQGAWPHQWPSVRAGSGLRGAYPDGGEHFLLHGGNAGVLCHLLAGCAGSGGINGHTKRPPGCLRKTSRRSFFTASPVAAPAARRRRTFRLSAPVGTRRGTSQRCCGRRPSPAPVRRAWWRGIHRWCGALRR